MRLQGLQGSSNLRVFLLRSVISVMLPLHAVTLAFQNLNDLLFLFFFCRLSIEQWQPLPCQ